MKQSYTNIQMRLAQMPLMIKLKAEDYGNIRRKILASVKGKEFFHEYDRMQALFNIDYEVDNYILNLEGVVCIDEYSAMGDGYFTPPEVLRDYHIELAYFQCTDPNGEFVATDFDYRRL